MTTIYDIAKAAGVTAATVSNVLADKGSVSVATRARIMKYVRELNYQPNLVARSLIKGRTGIIGFVVPTLANPFFAELTVEAELAAHEAGRRIFVTSLMNREGEPSSELINDLASRRVDGILLASGSIYMKAIQLLANNPHLPIVHCLWEGKDEEALSVSFDFYQAGQIAAEHLLQLGHRRFGIASHVQSENGLRNAGFHDTVLHSGCAAPVFQPSNSTIEGGRLAGHALLTLPSRPTAIFAGNDITAFGVMSMAWELGIRIPQDLSIIGLDDVAFASYTTPPLTSVRIDRKLIIKKALELLMKAIGGEETGPQMLLPPTLMVRSSTSSPPDSMVSE